MIVGLVLAILSSTVSIISLSLSLIFWIKKGFTFDLRASTIGIYIIWFVVIIIAQLYLAFAYVNNLFLLRIFSPIEILLLSYFLITFLSKSKIIQFTIPIIFAILVGSVDILWGTPKTDPIEEILTTSTILLWMSIFASKRINYGKNNNKAYLYFVIAITIGSIFNYSFIFSETSPILSAAVISTSTIISFSLYSIGFYILITK